MIRPIITAIRTLTIVPLPGKDTEVFSRSLLFFGVVGALLAGCMYGFFRVMQQVPPGIVPILIVVMMGFIALITGALHYDGLADFFDGFGGGRGNPEKIMLIMKDSRIGTFGALALMFDVALKFCLYTILIGKIEFGFIAMSFVASRSMQTVGCAFFPYARATGGTATPFMQGPYKRIFAMIAVVTSYAGCMGVFGWLSALLTFGVALVCGTMVFFWCYKKIGGITGDCIGAMNEIVEIAVLTVGIL